MGDLKRGSESDKEVRPERSSLEEQYQSTGFINCLIGGPSREMLSACRTFIIVPGYGEKKWFYFNRRRKDEQNRHDKRGGFRLRQGEGGIFTKKVFVWQFTKNLKEDLLGTPVRVTNIEPGMAETEFSLVCFHGDSEKAIRVYEGATSLAFEDIAEIVCWIVSPPPHANINNLEVMPVCQGWGPFSSTAKTGVDEVAG